MIFNCDLWNVVSSETLPNELGRILQLAHAPYGPLEWVELLDDLAVLSCEVGGLILVFINAGHLFLRGERQIFRFIEIFLVQHHHWQEKSKPCHLVFDMSKGEGK